MWHNIFPYRPEEAVLQDNESLSVKTNLVCYWRNWIQVKILIICLQSKETFSIYMFLSQNWKLSGYPFPFLSSVSVKCIISDIKYSIDLEKVRCIVSPEYK